MDVVDDHLAELVHKQVDRPDLTMQDQLGGILGIQRDAGAPGEVVPGAERDQTQDLVLELVALVQRRDHGVQRPVAAGDHDPT